LIAETGATPGPATFQGLVTATTGTAPAAVDALLSAIQTVPASGGGTLQVTIPAETASAANVAVASVTSCPVGAPANANCATYALIEPASNPSVGAFATGTVSFSIPAAGDVLYSIRANAFVPMSGGTSDCTPSSISTSLGAGGNPLKAVPGPAVTPKEIDFSGCS
jgi:hypothetical protein